MKFVYTFFNSFLRTLARIICYLVVGMLLCIILSKMGFKLFSNVYANTFIPEYYNIRGGGYDGTLMASSLSNASGIYTCANNSYCIMTIEAFLDTDTNYNNQPILTTLDVCSGVNNFPRYFDSSRNDTVFEGDLVSYQTTGSCKLYGQTVLRQRVKISWIPKYDLVNGYSNVNLLSLWSSLNKSGSDVAFQILSVKNDIYTPDMQAQDELNKQNDTIINQNDTIIDNQNGIKQGVENIDDTLKDESSPNLDALENTAGWLPAGPLDSVLNLPLNLLNNLTTNLKKTCNPVSLPLPFLDKNLELPCLNSIYSQIDGLSFFLNSISAIAAAFILFHYLMGLYKWVDDTLSFKENNYVDNWMGV